MRNERDKSAMKMRYLIAAMLIAVITILVYPIYYMPCVDADPVALQIAKSRSRLEEVRRVLEDRHVSGYEDLWDKNYKRKVITNDARLRLEQYLQTVMDDASIVFETYSTTGKIILVSAKDVLRDGWGNDYKVAWGLNGLQNEMCTKSKIGNVIVWSMGPNGIDDNGCDDDIYLTRIFEGENSGSGISTDDHD